MSSGSTWFGSAPRASNNSKICGERCAASVNAAAPCFPATLTPCLSRSSTMFKFASPPPAAQESGPWPSWRLQFALAPRSNSKLNISIRSGFRAFHNAWRSLIRFGRDASIRLTLARSPRMTAASKGLGNPSITQRISSRKQVATTRLIKQNTSLTSTLHSTFFKRADCFCLNIGEDQWQQHREARDDILAG